jgi:hypothetical protein
MNQNYLVALAIVAIVGSVFASTINVNSSVDMSHVSALYETSVTTQVCHVDGTCEPAVNQGHNLVVNSGLNWTIAKIFGVGGTGAATVIALGNATSVEVAGLLTINQTTANNPLSAGCALEPNTVTGANLTTFSSAGVSNQSLTWTWAPNCTFVWVNNTGLYNSTTMSGFGTTTVLFAGKNFASGVNLSTGDQLNVTWYVWATST